MSAPPTRDLFDRRLRALRHDRAARQGGDMFLHERAFGDCLERLGGISRRFQNALLLKCASTDWAERLGEHADRVEVATDVDGHEFGVGRFDLCVAVGTFDTVNELPLALHNIRRALKPDAPLIGAFAGGNSLPALRAALIEAERPSGRAVARTHPRIEAPAFAGLLSAAGFAMPVVDVDRVHLRYIALADLVRDLRAMGCTAVLADRPPPFSRTVAHDAARAFAAAGDGDRTTEVIDLIHFIGWAPQNRQAAG